jgi:Flp pilus assembly pilin Flp
MVAIRAFLTSRARWPIEYGPIAAGISIAIITVAKGLGSKLNSTFSSISTRLN